MTHSVDDLVVSLRQDISRWKDDVTALQARDAKGPLVLELKEWIKAAERIIAAHKKRKAKAAPKSKNRPGSRVPT